MSFKEGLNAEAFAERIKSIIDEAGKQGIKKADQVATDIGKTFGDGIVGGLDEKKDDIKKSIGELAADWQKFVKSITNNKTQMNSAKVKVVLDTAEALKDTERFGKTVTKQLSNIKATFGGIEVSGLENVLSKIKESTDSFESIDWGFGKYHDSIKKTAEATKELANATEDAVKTQEKVAKTKLRTQKQINAELEKENEKLKEIEKQQERNEVARERFKKKQANYGKEALGVDHAVYDTDLLKGAREALDEFNESLKTRNKYQEKYNNLCRMVEKYYVADYGVSKPMYKDLDDFVKFDQSMKELDMFFEEGQKTTNKHINELFKNVVQNLNAAIRTVARMISNGEITGDMIGQKLDKEETELNKEMQRLHDERQAQLSKINALRQEELSLIKQAGQEEKKNADIAKVTKPKSSKVKVREWTSEEFDAHAEAYKQKHGGEIEYLENVIDLVVDANKVGADFFTTCKKAETAVSRFFKALADYPDFASWEEGIRESISNGVYTGIDNMDGKGNKIPWSYSYGIESPSDDVYYVHLNLAKAQIESQELLAKMTQQANAAQREQTKIMADATGTGSQDQIKEQIKNQEKLNGVLDETIDKRKEEAKITEQATEAKSKYYEINEKVAKGSTEKQYSLQNLQKAYLASRRVYEVQSESGAQIFPSKGKADAAVANARALGVTISDPVEKFLGQIDDQLREVFERMYYKPSEVYKPGKDFVLQGEELRDYIVMIEGLETFKSQYIRLQKLKNSGATSAKIRPNRVMLDSFDSLLNESESISDNKIELLERILTQRLSDEDKLKSLLVYGRSDINKTLIGADPNSTWAEMVRYYDGYQQEQLISTVKKNAEVVEDQAKSTADAIEEQTTKTEDLAEARLKLTPKKDGSGGYTAMDGKYDISQDAEGWKVFQRDNAGLWNLIGTYKHFEDVKNDVSLLTREEIVRTDEVVQEIKALQEAYRSLRTETGGYMPVVNKYIEVLDKVKNGAMNATDAIGQLNEIAGVKTEPNKLKFADGTLLNDTQVAAVEKYCAKLKKSMGETYDEAQALHHALKLVFDISNGNVESLMGRFHNSNPASNAALNTLTGMEVNNQKNRDAALRSINPDAYDKIIAEQKEAAEKAKAELTSQKTEFQQQWDEFVSVMLGGDAFENESTLDKGKILKAFAEYGDTASNAIHEINKLWLKGEREGKKFKNKWLQSYVDGLNSKQADYDILRGAKVGDPDPDSLFDFSGHGTTTLTEEKAQALRNEAAVWDELIAKKKEYYGINLEAEFEAFRTQTKSLNDQFANSEQYVSKYLEVIEQIRTGALNAADAMQELNSFVNNVLATSTEQAQTTELAEKQTTDTQIQENQKLISSYEQLIDVVKEYVDLAKRMIPASTSNYEAMLNDINAVTLHRDDDVFAEIEAAYKTVKNIKSSQKSGLSVYKNVAADGSVYEERLFDNTLRDAEQQLRGYIYNAINDFEMTIDDVPKHFNGKRICAFVESQINKYLEIIAANNDYQAYAKSFNAPIEESIRQISSIIMSAVKDVDKSKVQDILDSLFYRADDVNRYTLSRETSRLGEHIGITTPDDEMQANAKKIESYKELCDVISRYHSLQKELVIYGGNQHPGLNEADEKELRGLRARLTATGGDDVWKLSSYGEFKDIDKLATTLGIEVPNNRMQDVYNKLKGSLQDKVGPRSSLRNIQKFLDNAENIGDLALAYWNLTNRLSEWSTDSSVTQEALREIKSILDEKGIVFEEPKIGANWERFQDESTERLGFYSVGKVISGSDSIDNPVVKSVLQPTILDASGKALKRMNVEVEEAEQHTSQIAKQTVDATKQTEAQAKAEEKVAEAANKTADAKERQIEAAKDATNILGDQEDTIGELLNRDVNEALAKLRTALNNKTELIDLSGVHSSNDLENALGSTVRKILGDDSILEFEKVRATINDQGSVATIRLINEELGITATQLWQLKSDADEAEDGMEDFAESSVGQLQHVADQVEYNRKSAEKYAKTQKDALDKSEKSLLGYQKRLDTLTRSYQHGSKTIKGSSNLLLPDATTLKDDADKTLDGLAAHIKDRINTIRQSLADGNKMTNDEQNSFVQDLNALENEIKIMQADTYKAGNMSSTEVNELRKSLTATLDVLASKARKSNVFDAISESYQKLHDNLNNPQIPGYLSDQNISDAVQRIRTLSKETTKEIQIAGETKKEQQDLQQLLNLQERLYEEKKKIAELDAHKKFDTSESAKATRKVEELEKQYKSSVELLKNEEQKTVVIERQMQLEKELSKFKNEKAQQYNNTSWKNQFQNNYKYNNGKTFEDQNVLNSMSDFYKQEESKAQQFNLGIKSIYNELVNTMKEINSLDIKINDLSLKDGGSGVYASILGSLQTQKSALVAQMRSIVDEINSSLNIAPGENGISKFFDVAREKAALTSEEIKKFDDLLRQAEEIGFNFAVKVAQQIQPVIEKIASLKQMIVEGTIDINSDVARNVLSAEANINNKLSGFKENPSAHSAIGVKKAADEISDYISAVDKAAQAEQKYFADKTKYTTGQTAGSLEDHFKNQTKAVDETQQKLEVAAKKFAEDSGFGDSIITNFSKTADGISRIDFSVFDQGANTLRNFRMEMGAVTDGIHITETTINKSLANIQNANKQIQSVGDLIGKLDASGVNVDKNTAVPQIQKLIGLRDSLFKEINKGDGANQNDITKWISDLKLAASEVEKLYKQMIRLDDAALNKDVYKNFGSIDPAGDKVAQATSKIQEFAQSFPNATVQVGRFNETTGKLPFTITETSGAMHSFEAEINGLNGRMVAQEKGVKQLDSSWGKLKTSLVSVGKQFVRAFIGYNVFYKVISTVRQGINYVKQIDLAMTELKKVTDETEASYKKFLETASQVSSSIGSTVSNFTEATANFARLGYGIDEAAEMAKTAIVYKNVADGLDTVEESTDSIISTMKAFGIEAGNTMQIIDVFNEVGKHIAQIT